MNRRRKYEQSNKGKKTRLFSREARRNFLLNMKAQLGCRNCGLDDPIILTFHHRNPKNKNFHLSAENTTRSWESTLKEVGKCDVLCFNCHYSQEDRDGWVR